MIATIILDEEQKFNKNPSVASYSLATINIHISYTTEYNFIEFPSRIPHVTIDFGAAAVSLAIAHSYNSRFKSIKLAQAAYMYNY